MALIPPAFLDCVVAIGAKKQNNEKAWIGTGFLFGKYLKTNADQTKQYRIYLVTNKHVINGQKDILLRFNPQTDQSSKDYEISLVNASTGKPIWTGHSNPTIDVAVLEVNPQFLKDEGMKFDFFRSDDWVINKSKMKTDITEGDFIYVLGFPMGMVDKDRQYVFLRQGVIARIRDMFEGRSSDYVIDAVVFPGNSGGPVILKPEIISIGGTKATNTAGLIGIIKSYIPYQEVAISQQTGRPRIIFEENTGLSLVEPTDHIIEAIELDEKNKSISAPKPTIPRPIQPPPINL